MKIPATPSLPGFTRIRTWMSLLLCLVATIVVLCFPHAARAEKRLVVAGIDKEGHLSYAWKGEKPLFHVTVTRPALPKNITIKNETGMKVKIQLFKGSDEARLAAHTSATLDTGKSASLPYQVFHLKVFETALFDKHLATRVHINSDVILRKRGNKLIILTVGVPVFSVTNKTPDTLEARIYNEGDGIRLIARKSFTVKPNQTFDWTNADIAKFRVRLHRAKFLGEALSDARNVNTRSTIVVEELEWSPWKKLLKTDWAGGRGKETQIPKTISALDGLTADQEGYTFGDGKRWPQIFGMGAGGSVWSQTLPDSPASDGIDLANRSLVWKLSDQGGEKQTFFASQVASTPFVVSDGHTTTTGKDKVLFARSARSTLISKRMYAGPFYNLNTNGDWTDLGGAMGSSPAALAYGGGRPRRLMAFIRNSADNTLRMRSRDKSEKWSGWSNLGGNLQGAPFACESFHGTGRIDGLSSRVDVFARGADNTLQHRVWLEGKGWQAWESLGGNLASSPVAYADSDGNPWPKTTPVKTRLYVFALGAADNVLYRYFDGSAWSDWTSLGGKFRSAPVVFVSDDSA